MVWRIGTDRIQSAYVEKLPKGLQEEWIPIHTYGGGGTIMWNGNRQLWYTSEFGEVQTFYQKDNFEQEYQKAVQDPYLGVYQTQNGKDRLYLYQVSGTYQMVGSLPANNIYATEAEVNARLVQGTLKLDVKNFSSPELLLAGKWGWNDGEKPILMWTGK